MSAVAPASFSLDVILWLQQWSPHPWLDSLMVGITLAGDPKIIFLFIAPLVCWLHAKNRLVGVDVLLGMVVSDWTNAMLKWPARGDRPYWHSDAVKEFSVTCESGFGMPSGHVMVSSAVAYILVSHVHPSRRSLARSVSIVAVVLIAITRQYVGAHFLGQVTLGAAIGTTVGWCIIQSRLSQRMTMRLQTLWQHAVKARDPSLYWRTTSLYALAASATVILLPVIEFFILSAWSDPLHSLKLAREGCEAIRSASAGLATPESAAAQAEFQLDRGPFMGVTRDAGVALGAIIAWAVVIAWDVDTASLAAMAGSTHAEPDGPPVVITHELSRARILLRAVLGLATASLLRWAVVVLFAYPPLVWFKPLMPSLFVYAANYVAFAATVAHYLLLAPALFREAEKRLGLATEKR